jgi:hypothetical protein
MQDQANRARVRLMTLVVCVAASLLVGPVRAHASPEAVAMLPLDADARLEIYGQPVASEIARALVAGGIEVVVVGPKMAVPVRARLVVDGSIKSKGDTVVLSIRVRNPLDGTVLETLSETAARLANIDQAAAALSARVLPVVNERIAAVHHKEPGPGLEGRPPIVAAPAPDPTLLIAITVAPGATAEVEPLRRALVSAVTPWTHAAHRVPVPTTAVELARGVAARTVAAKQAERGVVFEVLGYTVSPGPVPIARARVRVQIADASTVVFDRVVVTDSVLGERAMPGEALAARVAREVLAILRPHLRKLEPTWR